MSRAACKEEENSRIAEKMCVLKKKQRLFESYMRQGLVKPREIKEMRDADRALEPALDQAIEWYEKMNHGIAIRD